MRKLSVFVILLISISVFGQRNKVSDNIAINKILDDWHRAAAAGKADDYFGAMTDDAIFIGTDPEENWNKEQFIAFSKPYFDKGKAWDFKAVQRNIYFNKKGDTAWFDELLDTWMKLCRGSGILVKKDGQWKIAHYVLSMTVPNDNTTEVIKVIEKKEDEYRDKLLKK